MSTNSKRKARKPARSPKAILVPRDVVPPFPAVRAARLRLEAAKKTLARAQHAHDAALAAFVKAVPTAAEVKADELRRKVAGGAS